MSVNKVMLLGRLGQDVELKHTPAGNAVANFSVATGEKWVDKKGEKQERTEWHRIVAWGKTAELCNQYIKKGSEVFIEGKLQTRTWDDKEGVKRYTTEIQALSVQFLGKKDESVDAPRPTASPATAPVPNGTTPPNVSLDDIPF